MPSFFREIIPPIKQSNIYTGYNQVLNNLYVSAPQFTLKGTFMTVITIKNMNEWDIQ